MNMPGFTAEKTVSTSRGTWRGRSAVAKRVHAGAVAPQQDWSYHCEQIGSEMFCCDCWDGQCFCRKPGPIYEF